MINICFDCNGSALRSHKHEQPYERHLAGRRRRQHQRIRQQQTARCRGRRNASEKTPQVEAEDHQDADEEAAAEGADPLHQQACCQDLGSKDNRRRARSGKRLDCQVLPHLH